jgi:hypothetical protein
MNRTGWSVWFPSAIVAASFLSSACDVEVRGDHHGRDANVDIRTPVGSLSVRSDGVVPDTGLPVYPGAQPLRDSDEGHHASVQIHTSLFGMAVAAAEFGSPDQPAAVVEFYQAAMRQYGDVVVCRGDIDFQGRRDRQRAVCDDRPSRRETQLVVGTRDNYRMVAVKPRGNGSEFAVVRINTRQGS